MSPTAKAKTAKLIRTLLNSIPGSQQTQMITIIDNVQWAKTEKRIFLKHNLEIRLAGLPNNIPLHYRSSLPNQTKLKRLDDKMILTEVHLFESRIYRGIGNLSKAKAAALTSSRIANAITVLRAFKPRSICSRGYSQPKTTITYSYFFEAFENLSAHGDETRLVL